MTCPQYTKLNSSTKRCESIDESNTPSKVTITSDYCKRENKKLENQQCVDFCSPSHSYDPSTNTCVNQCQSMFYPLHDGSQNVCTECKNVIDNNKCVDSCPKSMATNKDNVCKPCIDSTIIYKLDGKCISKCPSHYESKDLYGDKNICSLIILNNTCSNSNNCENDGICNKELGSIKCLCKDGFY